MKSIFGKNMQRIEFCERNTENYEYHDLRDGIEEIEFINCT